MAAETSEAKSTMSKRSFENVRPDKKTTVAKKPVKPAKIPPKITPKKASSALLLKLQSQKFLNLLKMTNVEKTQVDHPIKPARKPRKFLKLPKKGKKDSDKLKEPVQKRNY